MRPQRHSTDSRFIRQNRDFHAFHLEQAIGFKRHLAEQKGQRSGKGIEQGNTTRNPDPPKTILSMACMGTRLQIAPSVTPMRSISICPTKTSRIARARREQKVPTLEQIKHVINSMPASTEIEHRNRALIAFTLLTGARDSAIASMKLKHVDLTGGQRGSRRSGSEHQIQQDLHHLLLSSGRRNSQDRGGVGVISSRRNKLWGNEDPLFPATRSGAWGGSPV